MSKLKPCPFCGGAAELRMLPHCPSGWDWTPRCKKTSCPGRITKKYNSVEYAVFAWNRRYTGD